MMDQQKQSSKERHHRHHRHGSGKNHSRKSDNVATTTLMDEHQGGDGRGGGRTATDRPHSPSATSPTHSPTHSPVHRKSVKMRTASKDFPLGAFAAKDELPKKSNRESITASITHGAPGHRPRKNKAILSASEGVEEQSAELAGLVELGLVEKPAAAHSPPGGRRGKGSRRGGRGPLAYSKSETGGLGTIAYSAPMAFELGKNANDGKHFPEQVVGSPSPASVQKPKVGRSILEATAPLSTYDTMNEQKKQENDIAAFASMALGQQEDDIAAFSSIALGQYGDRGSGIAVESKPAHPIPAIPVEEEARKVDEDPSKDWDAPWDDELDEECYDETAKSMYRRIMSYFDLTPCLMSDVKLDENGVPYFNDWRGWGFAGFVRTCFYNPLSPEFTALQQFDWAVMIGIAMGFFTAVWKVLIENCVHFVWETIPEFLLEHGVFTESEGPFPLYHYMWLCPAFLGGVISFCFAALPKKIPDQNEWINNIHNRGVQDYRTFWLLIVLSTAGMASGLSLGPELPLVLTAGMAGSWLGLRCNQSVLQARVMNLTAASAAVGGFFGFPMAGALFVLEIPHRMGLQYFEALSPATISSIVAVLTNRIIVGNDVTGYYKYPFLTATLPSEIFSSAIIFGLYGALVGVGYVKGVKMLKGVVHDWFHKPQDHDDHESSFDHRAQEESREADVLGREKKPLLGQTKQQKHIINREQIGLIKRWKKGLCCVMPNEVYRSAVAGSLAGAICGAIGMFVPHVMFWGEAQLQTLIDRGVTPLPVFGFGDEPTAGLTYLSYCVVDHTKPNGMKDFGIGCSFLISASKIVVTGLSLGTGIVGGHFWGPLFVGCSASHFLVDSVRWLATTTGFGGRLAAYPCVAMLCTMGSTHVVTFRAHMAIMLILTLTISAFNPEEGDDNGGVSVAGDYSAVFPLLVVAVFVSLMVSRQTVFYPTQRSRGDIMAVPEVLCEPGMEGRPMVIVHEGSIDGHSYSDHSDSDSAMDVGVSSTASEELRANKPPAELTQSDIEREFQERAIQSGMSSRPASSSVPSASEASGTRSASPAVSGAQKQFSDRITVAGVPPTTFDPPVPSSTQPSSDSATSSIPKSEAFSDTLSGLALGSVYESCPEKNLELSSSRLDELLNLPMSDEPEYVGPPRTATNRRRHRRIQSAPVRQDKLNDHELDRRFGGDRPPTSVSTKGAPTGVASPQHKRTNSGNLVRIASFGEVKFHQPSLLDQARARAASAAEEYLHRRVNSISERPKKSPQDSASSLAGGGAGSKPSPGGHSRKNSGTSLPTGPAMPSSGGHRRKNSEPLPASASASVTFDGRARHLRKSSEPFGGPPPRRPPSRGVYNPPATPKEGGALPFDDIELAFDALLESGGGSFR